MAWAKAEPIILSEKQVSILNELQRGRSNPTYLKRRSEIIILAADGKSTNEISKIIGISRLQVRHWRNKFINATENLGFIEATDPSKLKKLISDLLKDEQRSGKKPTFTVEQKAQIIALACQNPIDLGLPFSHWTHATLTNEVIRSGIVPSISTAQVGRFLKSSGIKTAPVTDVD